MAVAVLGVMVAVLGFLAPSRGSVVMPAWMRVVIPLAFLACSIVRLHSFRARWLGFAAASVMLLNSNLGTPLAHRAVTIAVGASLVAIGLREQSKPSEMTTLALGIALVVLAFATLYFFELSY